jgi:hypothetical protein
MVINVSNCEECPFRQGASCRMDFMIKDFILIKDFNKIHKKCPVKKTNVTVNFFKNE